MREQTGKKFPRWIQLLLILLILGFGGSEAYQQFGDTEARTETEVVQGQTGQTSSSDRQSTAFRFRNRKLLEEHYEKHGQEMGFESAEAYEKAASAVAENPKALHKLEKEDGDDVYYLEETNEFVIVSTDGYLRTYFSPAYGRSYFERQ